MIIRNAEVRNCGLVDLSISNGRIAAIHPCGEVPGEFIDAKGGALLPGLHDHHIHLAALAAREASIQCGPPDVTSAESLARSLAVPGTGWLRGIGYHESVMGLPDATGLDSLVAHRPLRIQHRSGRMWLLNSLALEELLAHAPVPRGLEMESGRPTGRLFDEDGWLQAALGSSPPDFASVSAGLAARGVTGITDMSPRNDTDIARHFSDQREKGALRQHCILAGSLALAEAAPLGWSLGPAKLHLHEAALPSFEETCAFIAAAHAQGRGIATHCTTEVELVFALAALDEAGIGQEDRIEHASITTIDQARHLAANRIAVVAQPHFVLERGDRYLVDVDKRHLEDLYRLASLREAGIVLAGGSDAPFGDADPWASMAAAVSRETRDGALLGPAEALTPEQALSLYLAAPDDLSNQRRIAPGEPADFCLLDRPWAEARLRLSSDDVRTTFIAGQVVYDRVDQPPLQRLGSADPAAR